MAEHIGIVIKKESDKYAQVVTDRKGACGVCQSTPHGCRSCLSSAKMESRVANPLGAEPGDLVKIHLSSENLYLGAAILYLIPVIGLLIGAFIGAWVSLTYGLTGAVAIVGSAAAGLVIGFAVVMVLDRTAGIRRRIMPTITSVLTTNVEMPDNKEASCCG
ncbi:MAG TPA: SoxR reducing system RseC family protein [Desulfosarcina sp.]|nr:SoxR reducing system RseC family protein [Desulfosarcina sp.]